MSVISTSDLPSLKVAGKPAATFTIGVCVSDGAENLGTLLERLSGEPFPPDFTLKKIVIVASGCSEDSLAPAKVFAEKDRRILLVEEPGRCGKAVAINKVIERFGEDYLVFVNGDALPAPGSVERVLRVISTHRGVGAVSGAPDFEVKGNLTSAALRLMWMVHNECALTLNDRGISNHGSDELIVLRSEVLRTLPRGIVNDGGYLTGHAYAQGYKIMFCRDAGVKIDVPSRFIDVIEQRRRIIFGHIQVWKLIGRSPRTVETLLLSSPLAGLSILVRSLARSPRLIRLLPVVVVGEMIASITAIFDIVRSSSRHVVWKRYGD